MDVDLIDRVRFGSDLTQKLAQQKSFKIELELNDIKKKLSSKIGTSKQDSHNEAI
jgi:hypothetical protein